jgi:hypothetical protein
MTDLVLIVATLAFVAICVAYIGWCDRIIGPDEPYGDAAGMAPPADAVGVTAAHEGASA